MEARRFLLDQGFPKPTAFAEGALQGLVQFEHFDDVDPESAGVSTPDWMVQLIAEERGFEGLVTRDPGQLDEPEAAIALLQTNLSVITWSKGIDDTITEWGLLVAFMPLVIKRIEQSGPAIFILPKPHLDPKRSILQRQEKGHQVARASGTNLTEMRDEALHLMKGEVEYRNRGELLPILERPPRRAPRTVSPEPADIEALEDQPPLAGFDEKGRSPA